MKRRLVCILFGVIVTNVAPASAVNQKVSSKRPPRKWLLKLLQERQQMREVGPSPSSGTAHNKTGVWSLEVDDCVHLCRQQTADPTYQRECIAQCRTHTDLTSSGGNVSQASLRRFAQNQRHDSGARDAYEDLFGESVSKPCMRTLQPRAGAGLGAEEPGQLSVAFEEADSDGDGNVTQDEMRSLATRLCVGQNKLEDVLEKHDSDGDKKLKKDEWNGGASRDVAMYFELQRFKEDLFVEGDGAEGTRLADRFAELDIDGNGKLEDFELGAGFVADIMDRYATASTEMEDLAAEVFWDHQDQIMPIFDANADGTVSLEEFIAAEGGGAAAASNSSETANVSLLASSSEERTNISDPRHTRDPGHPSNPRNSRDRLHPHHRHPEEAWDMQSLAKQLHEAVLDAAQHTAAKVLAGAHHTAAKVVAGAAHATSAVKSVAQGVLPHAVHAAVFGKPTSTTHLRGGPTLPPAKISVEPMLHVHAFHRVADGASATVRSARSTVAGATAASDSSGNPEADPVFHKQIEEAWAAVVADTGEDVALKKE